MDAVGDAALRFFHDAEKLGGIPAKVRLASLARTTSAEASASEDTSALLTRLQNAYDRLKRELSGTSTSGVYVPPITPHMDFGRGDSSATLRRQLTAIVDLMSQRDVLLPAPEDTVRRVNEAVTSAMPVARVSVWLLLESRSRIVCMDLFDAPKRSHENGMELLQKDFPAYFEALQSERTIVVRDARVDPRTSGFTKSYLDPLNIGALLDVPLWVRGHMVGVLCHEHIGGARAWNADEEKFAYLASCFVALAFERVRPPSMNPPPRE